MRNLLQEKASRSADIGARAEAFTKEADRVAEVRRARAGELRSLEEVRRARQESLDLQRIIGSEIGGYIKKIAATELERALLEAFVEKALPLLEDRDDAANMAWSILQSARRLDPNLRILPAPVLDAYMKISAGALHETRAEGFRGERGMMASDVAFTFSKYWDPKSEFHYRRVVSRDELEKSRR